MNQPFNPNYLRAEQALAVETHPVHDARDLTGDNQQAWIMLDGMRYVLRITRQGKLILTK